VQYAHYIIHVLTAIRGLYGYVSMCRPIMYRSTFAWFFCVFTVFCA